MTTKPKIKIIKANGEEELYSRKKFRGSLQKADVSKKLIDAAQEEVEKKLHEGTTTDELYDIAHKFLKKESTSSAARYSLKKAIMQLGPAGYLFEKYLSAVLSAHGYKTDTNLHMKGKCITHEIDVTAEDDKNFFVIEAKYHNSRGTRSDVKTVLYTYARFLDIKSNKKKDIDYKPWLITNTKFTSQAIKYSECQGIKVTGWNYPKKESLNNLIEEKNLYPVTAIPSVNRYAREQFSKAGIYFASDLKNFSAQKLKEKFGIFEDLTQKIEHEVNDFINNK